MDIVLLIARLVLAGVFLAAGIGKLGDLPGSRQAMERFGVPVRLAGFAGLALPVAEILLASALVPLATAWWGALGALLLLLVFLAAIGYNLAHGRTPDCHCFGQLHSAPAGPRTLVRNGILAALAALVVTSGFDDPGTDALAWAGGLTGTAQVGLVIATLLTGAVTGLGWLVSQVMLQNGRLLVRLDALDASLAAGRPVPATPEPAILPGMPAPVFTLPNLDVELVSLDALRQSGKPVLLVFSDPNCRACTGLLPSLAAWQADGRLTVALVSRGALAANRVKTDPHGLSNVLLQEDRETALAYGVDVTPTAVVIDPAGIIGSPLARGTEDIKALVARALPPLAPAHPAPLAVGEAGPALVLPTLNGDPVDLAGPSPSDRVLLFWNPGCDFCQRMVDDLRAWEAHRVPDAPALMLISAGDAGATRAHGFASTVLLDGGQGVGRRFGAHGTPAAVRMDTEGRIASPVATGKDAVLGLLRATSPAASNGHR